MKNNTREPLHSYHHSYVPIVENVDFLIKPIGQVHFEELKTMVGVSNLFEFN
jgi:hypothetical protein